MKQLTKKIYIRAILFVTALTFTHSIVYAQGFINPIGSNNLWEFLQRIITSVVYILFPILVLMIVYTGYLFVSAQGNPGKLDEAKKALVWTLIGSFVVLGAQALAMAIRATIESL